MNALTHNSHNTTANYKYDTPHADFTEPGIGAFIIILFMQLLMVTLLFIGLESKALDKEFLKKLIFNCFNKHNPSTTTTTTDDDQSHQNKVTTTTTTFLSLN